MLAKGTFNNLAQLESVLGDGRAPPGRARARRGDRCLSARSAGGRAGSARALDSLAGDTSRRGFLARVGGALTALTAGGLVAKAVKPGEADAFHFCGHIYTTGSCLHPTGLPRIDGHGYPLRRRRRPAGRRPRPRRSTARASRSTTDGEVLRDPDGRPLPPAPRTKVCDATGARLRLRAPRRRRLVSLLRRPACASWSTAARTRTQRINGDAALEGYCYRGRKVFCVMYFQTKVPC